MVLCRTKVILLFSILLLSIEISYSQCELSYVFRAETNRDVFGYSVSGAGDVNGNGYSDFIVGAPADSTNGSFSGKVYVFSGLTGDTLHVFTGNDQDDILGFLVSDAGDVDNDSFDDVMIGEFSLQGDFATFTGQVYVFSGRTGDTIYTFTSAVAADGFGLSFANAGDVNNDQVDDIIIGAPGDSPDSLNAGRAYIFSGETGDTLYVLSGEITGAAFGIQVSGAGDVNNDGFDDVIITARRDSSGNANSTVVRAYVYSGRTGEVIHTFFNEALEYIFGSSMISTAGDVNNDGFDDLIFGLPLDAVAGLNSGRAFVISGKTADTIMILEGESEGDEFGYSVSSAGDPNNDGFDDVIVGARWNKFVGQSVGRAYLYSGQNGKILTAVTPDSSARLFGSSVAAVGDINNDGFDDFIVGAPSDAGSRSDGGRAYIYFGPPCLCADPNGDFLVNVDDVAYLIDYYFYSGNSPVSLIASDLNCDGSVNIADITYLAAYLNGTGAPPCCAE